MIKQLNIDGNIKNHIEIPEDLITLSSLLLFSFMNVCIELNKKTVGKIMGNNDGKCKKAILITISKGISFDELLLKSSIRSMVRKRKHEKKEINTME